MYKTFLSWRYLVTRRTNFIGIVGIFVAVGALIMILSIMSGFLEQTKAMVRGGLSDLVVTPPARETRVSDDPALRDPSDILARVRADERIAAASARLVWFALMAPDDESGFRSELILSDPSWGGQSAVQVVGVDVATPWRAALPVWAATLPGLGVQFRAPRVQDEFDTTAMFDALVREPHPDRPFAARVQNALSPFQMPPGYGRDGRPLEAVVVGERLMNSLALSRGMELTLVTFVPDGDGGARECKRTYVIAGSFRTQDNEMDGQRIYMDRAALADLLNDGRTYTEVVARLDDYERDSAAVRKELPEGLAAAGLLPRDPLSGQVPDGHVRTWEDFRQSLLGAIENERVLMAIMLSLILVVAGFTIFSILTMMVTEKRRDIGILSAVGATPRGVLSTFLLIGFWNALLGTSFGALAGVLGALHIDRIERWLSSAFQVQIFNRNVYYFDEIPSRVELVPVLLIVGGAFLCTLLFAAIPAWRAGHMNPLDALRYE